MGLFDAELFPDRFGERVVDLVVTQNGHYSAVRRIGV